MVVSVVETGKAPEETTRTLKAVIRGDELKDVDGRLRGESGGVSATRLVWVEKEGVRKSQRLASSGG